MRVHRCLPLVLLFVSSSLLSAAEPLYHLLAKGETLFAVARIYGISAESIESANGIGDPGKLKVGQRLLIPRTHRVEKGETLYGIAKSASISVVELRRINGLSPTAVIKVGDTLYLPSSLPEKGASDSGPETTSTVTGPSSQPKVDRNSATPGPAPLAQPAIATLPSGTVRVVSTKAALPCAGEARYLDGKLFGIAIKSSEGSQARAVASGTVVSAGPYRGFGSVAFIQSKSGLIYVYGGNGSLDVRLGDLVRPGQVIGRIGRDQLGGNSDAYFFVFKAGIALDPTQTPRD